MATGGSRTFPIQVPDDISVPGQDWRSTPGSCIGLACARVTNIMTLEEHRRAQLEDRDRIGIRMEHMQPPQSRLQRLLTSREAVLTGSVTIPWILVVPCCGPWRPAG